MKNYLFLTIIAAFFIGLISCETMDDPEMTTTSTWPLNGEYRVTYDSTANGNPFFSERHALIITNTSADNGDSIVINDASGTGYKYKAAVNMTQLSFSAENYQYDSTTTITVSNAKLIEDGTKSPYEDVVTDSLYMEVEITTPTGTDAITISGYKYAGWANYP